MEVALSYKLFTLFDFFYIATTAHTVYIVYAVYTILTALYSLNTYHKMLRALWTYGLMLERMNELCSGYPIDCYDY